VRQLTATEQLQKTLLDTIAHDLKTPLTAIVGSLNTLMVEAPRLDAGDRQELIETAYAQSVWLNRLVGDLLEMGRLEAGVAGLRRDQAQIGEVVDQAIAQVRRTIGGRECRVEIAPTVPAISIDRVLLSHALANILENAAKYSPAEAPIDVTAHPADGHVVVAVADRGIGVPAHDLGRIFDKFYRPAREQCARGRTDGTGLGLAIARGVVEAHGGRIWAEDRPGAGMVVKLRLPVGAR
jgi:two-component system sensor histidine kinase KdpD